MSRKDWKEFDQNWGINLDKYEKVCDNKSIKQKSYLDIPKKWLESFKNWSGTK